MPVRWRARTPRWPGPQLKPAWPPTRQGRRGVRARRLRNFRVQVSGQPNTGMSCPSWQWHRTGYRRSPVRTLPVAPLWCDLGRCSRTLVVLKLRRMSAFTSSESEPKPAGGRSDPESASVRCRPWHRRRESVHRETHRALAGPCGLRGSKGTRRPGGCRLLYALVMHD